MSERERVRVGREWGKGEWREGDSRASESGVRESGQESEAREWVERRKDGKSGSREAVRVGQERVGQARGMIERD